MELDHQSSRDFDDLFDNPTLGGLGSAGPPGQLHGGVDMSRSNFGRPLAPNMAGPSSYRSSEFALGPTQTPSLNPGFNPSSLSHMIPHQYQWETSNRFTSTHGTSDGNQSQVANRRALLLAGLYLQGPMTSYTQPQANRNQAAFPFQMRHEPAANWGGMSSANNQAFQMGNTDFVNAPMGNSGIAIPAPVPHVVESPDLEENEENSRYVRCSALV
jgi:hypothetical protein